MTRYRSYNSYLRELFGERVQKIPLDAGFTCPNRDGTISKGGCIYCDRRGSGSGAMTWRGESLDEQIAKGMRWAGGKYGASRFIAYFQSFTNTYGPVPRLRELYDSALKHEGMVGLSVGTRPDCVDEAVLELLAAYKDKFLVWLELGLQSSHDSTLRRINRGHDVACFDRAVAAARTKGLNVCAHVILGLPAETREMMMETARHLRGLPVEGVKIHALYVVKDTPLAGIYAKGDYRCLERDEYVDLVLDFLEQLPSNIVIQRLTGDPVLEELVAPLWVREKRRTLNLIWKRFEEGGSWQGKSLLL
ncbi:MAG: TIGR01212 family radical SAM protein [Deltaproteobacteria bacterium]